MSNVDKLIAAYCHAHPWIEKVVIILCFYAWIAMICVAVARRKG